MAFCNPGKKFLSRLDLKVYLHVILSNSCGVFFRYVSVYLKVLLRKNNEINESTCIMGFIIPMCLTVNFLFQGGEKALQFVRK